jgi:amidase
VSAFCDDVLGTADGVEIARRIENREISAYEAIDAAIARAERVNPRLNAIAAPLFDAARQAAAQSPSGALAGVPSFIKDNEAVARPFCMALGRYPAATRKTTRPSSSNSCPLA